MELSVHQNLARHKAVPQRGSSVCKQAKVGVRILSEDVLSCLHSSLHEGIPCVVKSSHSICMTALAMTECSCLTSNHQLV